MGQSFMTVAVLPIPNLVFFPHTSLPLFISEPRHVQMIRDCISKSRFMAVSLIDIKSGYTNLRNSPRAVCTVGEPVIVNENDDGSIKVLLRGRARIKLLTLKQSIPYMLYTAEEIPDIPSENDFQSSDGIEKLRLLLQRWSQENIYDSIERDIFNATVSTAKHVVDSVSMYMIMDPEVRQLLLENVHLGERVQMLTTLLKSFGNHEDQNVAEALKTFEAMDSNYRHIAH